MKLTAPTDAAISIELYDRERHPELDGFFTGSGVERLSGYALILTNRSSMDIVGLATRWTVTDRDGRERITKLSFDSFGDSVAARQPVIPAGARLVATPGGFQHVRVPPAAAVGGGSARTFGWGRGQLVSVADLNGAQRMTAVVEAIIFADGRVVGPDESNLVGHINALSAAFKSTAGKLREAIAAGNLDSVLRDLVSARSRLRRPDDDPAAFWAAMEADRILRFPTPSFDGRLRQLEEFPAPPAFYR